MMKNNTTSKLFSKNSYAPIKIKILSCLTLCSSDSLLSFISYYSLSFIILYLLIRNNSLKRRERTLFKRIVTSERQDVGIALKPLRSMSFATPRALFGITNTNERTFYQI